METERWRWFLRVMLRALKMLVAEFEREVERLDRTQ